MTWSAAGQAAEALATPAQVARYLQVPEGTLAQWRYLRKGPPFIKVEGHVRYRQADVERWLKRQASEAKAG